MAAIHEHEATLKRVETFLDKTLLSKRAASGILGVSQATLVRWLAGDTVPYEWSAATVLARIDVIDNYDEEHDGAFYPRLRLMSKEDRTEALREVLDAYLN